MFRMFKRLFRAFAGLSSAFSKTARSLEHIASATEELSESLLIEERLRRQARIEELRRQIAATQLDPPVSIKSDRLQSTRPTKHTAPQTEPCLGREQQFAPAPIVVEVQRTLIRKQPCGKATDDSPSGGPAEAPPYWKCSSRPCLSGWFLPPRPSLRRRQPGMPTRSSARPPGGSSRPPRASTSTNP